MQKARVLVLDVKKPDVRQVVVEELADYYEQLACDTFDIARRQIGERYYDIFCDDIGLFREDAVVSAIDDHDNPMLVGNLLIANHDADGNTTSLTDDDLNIIGGEILVGVHIDAEGKIMVSPAVRCRY